MGMKILADFVRILRDLEEDGFLSWCVSESAIGFAALPGLLVSFCHPPIYIKITVFLHFSVYLQSRLQVVFKTTLHCILYYNI